MAIHVVDLKSKWLLNGLVLWAVAYAGLVAAEERLCPDGKRAYFGVCPGDAPSAPQANNSRPPLTPTCADCPDLVDIPGGSFMMGSSVLEKDAGSDERPRHEVHVDRFALGKYEVTRQQFAAFVDATNYPVGNCTVSSDKNWLNPGFTQDNNHPVVCVSAGDAEAYARWLSEKTGQRYRLPTEAEWEYAARAGTTTAFYTGDCVSTTQANYDGNYDYAGCGAKTGTSLGKTAAAGSYASNAWGLHDMAGNVWEWTCSAYTASGYQGEEKTCTNDANSRRVVRGGSWNYVPTSMRSAFRGLYDTSTRLNDLGFRLAQDR